MSSGHAERPTGKVTPFPEGRLGLCGPLSFVALLHWEGTLISAINAVIKPSLITPAGIAIVLNVNRWREKSGYKSANRSCCRSIIFMWSLLCLRRLPRLPFKTGGLFTTSFFALFPKHF
jgi:hypothetical protein